MRVPLLVLSVLVACAREEPPPPLREPAPAGSAAPANKPEWVPIPPDASDGAELVRAELTRAESDGRKLVVYVGASWCEPCQHFHQAVERGELDAELAGVRILDFDHDRHGDLLERAGCTSKMLPLFARPAADGRCGPARTEGGIKGPRAVEHILPRLREILAR